MIRSCGLAGAVCKICIAIGIIAVGAALLFRAHWFSSEAQTQIDAFLSSPEEEIQIIKLFPWPWEYVCSTGDYANMRAFKNALGRPITLGEQLLWFWYGSDSENTDNLIFEDSAGRIHIHQYDFLGKPSFHGYPSATRGRCVRRAEHVYVIKRPGNFGGVYSLDVLSK